MKALKQEYAALSAENKRLYPQQKAARKKMIDLPPDSRRRRRLKTPVINDRGSQGLGGCLPPKAAEVYTEALLATTYTEPYLTALYEILRCYDKSS
ncbi:MAG: hypothetical protein LUC89_04990 [Oscillospiraceae bacterium]|nr:hypothetical protein [Oscillospiraceae bacterium]